MSSMPNSAKFQDPQLERVVRVLVRAREKAHARLDKVFEELIAEARQEALAACPLSG
jgi:hypothetical protein